MRAAGEKRGQRYNAFMKKYEVMRILITRTDRIGDVMLSTPVIKAVRDRYPDAFIAFVVRPYARDIVVGNPYLDEVIIYDKKNAHKTIGGTLRFAKEIRRKKFDISLVLHPTNRMHLVTFLAGIPERIGYNRKLGFLLTRRLPHTKQEGEKHELEYTLDIIRAIGITPEDKRLYMPVHKENETRINSILSEAGLRPDDRLVALGPGASCASKRWLPERFAEVGDEIAARYKARIVLIGAPRDKDIGDQIVKTTRHKCVNLIGKTTVGELAPLLSKCKLFISNDSGPVHIAVAVGTPVIAIFGRNDSGLSPARWRPLGPFDVVLHKHMDCNPCLTHNCEKDFICLSSITSDEVLKEARKILG